MVNPWYSFPPPPRRQTSANCYILQKRVLVSLEIRTSKNDQGIAVIEFSGSILLWPEGQIDFLQDLLDQHTDKLILDLGGLEHMDSSGVELMVECYKTAGAAGAELRFANAKPRVTRLFQVTKLDTILPLFPTVAAACAGFTAA